MPFIRIPILILLLISIFTLKPVNAMFSGNDNPGADQPDDSAFLGEELYPADLENISLKTDNESRLVVLDSGFSREAAIFLGLFLPVRMISMNEISDILSGTKLLVIPSGGLSSLDDNDRVFRELLGKYVNRGGNLLLFSQRFGEDYKMLPLPDGMEITAFGWLEDQSKLTSSSILSLSHPILSNITTQEMNLNIDGYIEIFPEKSKPLIRNRVSGQPVMIVYKYGKGHVIASSLFTDWAYLHQRATRDEMKLFGGLVKWAGLTYADTSPMQDSIKGVRKNVRPVPLPPLGFSVQSDNEIYLAGDNAGFTIRLWNNEKRTRRIKIYYDGKGEVREVKPGDSIRLSYSIPVYSTRRLWVYFYDENEIFLQTLRRGYSVVYPE